MADQPVLIPGADHPITITPTPARVTVRTGDTTLAETARALTLQESNYPPVVYVPRDDADMAQLVRSDRTTHCPYKGKASYYSIPALGERGKDAVWTYETPHEAVAAIAGHLAFYPDRVQITQDQATATNA